MRQTLKYPFTRLMMPDSTKTRIEKWVDWRSAAEFVRSRLVYKSLDAALTACLRPPQQREDYLKALLKWRTSNYERVAAGTNLVDTFVPGFARRVSTRLIDSSRFPFAGAEVRLLSYGSGSTVFLLRRPDRDWVLKIYRRSLGKKGSRLAQVANHFKEKYETVCSWYNGRFNLVPPAHFIILYGPIFSSPAAAVLQGYIHGRKSDLFLDHSNDRLLEMMETDEELMARFLFFAEQTLYAYRQHNLCIDLLGRENVMLVENNGRHRLLVVDNGIFNLETLHRMAPQVLNRIETRLERLCNLQALLR